jgi:hypothetical protein
MKAANKGGSSRTSLPSGKGSSNLPSGGRTSFKNHGQADRKLGYGGEKYPTQKQVKKAAKKKAR